jgi:ATP-dependent DNA ligase
MYIDVQLAESYKDYTNKAVVFNGNHILEPKIDGLRGELANDGIYSRYGNKWGFPSDSISDLLSFINKLGFFIDGEFDYLEYDKYGKLLPHFERRKLTMSILKRLVVPKHKFNKLIFTVFDVIPISGNLTLKDRKALVTKIVPLLNTVAPFQVKENPYGIIKSKKDFDYWFDTYIKRGYEGAMIKNFRAIYHRKRTSDWLKVKPTIISDLPILRVEAGEKGKKNEFRMGFLVVKTPKGEAKIGTGFPDKGYGSREYFWENRNHIKGVVVEIEHEGYANQQGSLLNASFKLIRDDKPKWEMSF